LPVSFRDQQRLEAIEDRGGLGFDLMPKCDLCQLSIASDYHEIIKRSQTIYGSDAREMSYQKQLCSYLCKECHEIADEKLIEARLWRFNLDLYGIEAVQNAIDQLQSCMRRHLVIEGLNGLIG
jgi:hypothetical protein